MTHRPARRLSRIAFGLALAAGLALPTFAHAADLAVDTGHANAFFKVRHAGVSDVWGLFRSVDGKATYDPAAPDKSSFDLSVKVDSIDTNSAKRDEHLKGPDFFSAKEFPSITFKSKNAKLENKKLVVNGDLTLHGVTKPVTLHFDVAETEFPKGVKRFGFTSELALKRSDYGMKGMVGPVGDDIHIHISFEATPK